MKLSYRGVEYNYQPISIEVTEPELIGQYRGRPCYRTHLASIPVPQATHLLKYRGAVYQSGVAVSPLAPEPVTVAPLTVPASPAAAFRYRGLSEADQVHNIFIRRTLEHRLAVAKRQGNDNLVKLLEMEQQHFN
ncbi:DUF4278 domain-containing protein [Synechococcales cyanobacterium C]|uniref:DUF4278 domain-containing protein n=1 Tax=Petrachloros mirabilis ULC683 TaxID=2781853 RepID=A0A8K1ZZB1_9CYAN|nr:DUF4278 domain-containing protein [Petrachloros mirabilis]NCJ06871.1 DUF4278 domain-containing protein [Petrachloros mirabilis ULC683]